MRTGLLWSLLWPAAIGGFALGAPVAVLAVLFIGGGMGFTLFIVWWETALAQRIPPHLLSRVTSYDWMGSLALLPLGYLIAGPLGTALGTVDVLAVGAAVAILAQAGGLLVRQTWTLGRFEEAAAP
jgi:hypothetical protein